MVVIVAVGPVFEPLGAILVLWWAHRSGTPWREIGFVRPRSWAGTLSVGIPTSSFTRLFAMPLFSRWSRRSWSAVFLAVAACGSSARDQRHAGSDSTTILQARGGAVVAGSDGTYELELPTRWQGHFRTDSLSPAERGLARPGALIFEYLPSDSTIRPQALLVVAVYDSAAWRSVRAEEGPRPGDSVAAGHGRVYVVALPQSNPFPPGTADATVFRALQLQPSEVGFLIRLR